MLRNENEIIKVISNLKTYVSEDIRSIDVDVCGNGYGAFLEPYYDMIHGPTCKKEHFHPFSICQSTGMNLYEEYLQYLRDAGFEEISVLHQLPNELSNYAATVKQFFLMMLLM